MSSATCRPLHMHCIFISRQAQPAAVLVAPGTGVSKKSVLNKHFVKIQLLAAGWFDSSRPQHRLYVHLPNMGSFE